ncbi:MAG: EAL domain-containing protein [Terracidiphilus sp.]|jgi:diguanylate cyclase (GGDEF)-like protein
MDKNAPGEPVFHPPVIFWADKEQDSTGPITLFNSINSDRYRPPSSLASGRFLTLIAVQLIAVGMGLGISRHVYMVCHDVAVRHEDLAQSRQQIDRLSASVDQLLPAVQDFPADGDQAAAITSELDSAMGADALLQSASAELSGQTAEVQQSVADLNAAWQACRKSRRGPARVSGAAELFAAIGRVKRALNDLRNGVDRQDEANLDRVAAIQQVRLWAIAFQGLACILVVFSFGYALQLYRQLRREELARFHMQSELAAERAALENRVQARTSALAAEVKERQRAERLNRGRNRMLEMVARNEPIGDIFRVLAETVAEFSSTWICEVHSLNSGSLKLVASSGLSDKLKQHLRSISASFADAPESVAVTSGEPYLVEDLGAVHKPWSELLRANGLLSVWSAPYVASDADVLGTLSVYTLLQWTPSSADLEMLEMCRHMAALVMERSRLQTQLIDHAYHDSLTGLPNRRLARDRIANAIKRAARTGQGMAVLWIDLDRFKQINDQYGHPVGDAVLQQTAERLSGRLRSSDTLARMGGDEFMALIEGTSSREAAETTAADLLEVLAHPMQVEELELSITASIGISLYPEDGKTGDSLAQHADQAMYAAKFGCCGFRSFSPEMDREPAERRELEAELNHALETGGFTVAYQPLCLPNGVLHGFEALLRFHSPRLGNVPPCDFIPIAEETQLIVPLGEWVLREVCRQSREWQKAGHPAASIAVNISALQFARDDFADTVAQILEETGQPAEMLVLELTESIVMHDFAESAHQMERLKRLGVRIAIDDFGTGYSSLSYLHRLPIDVLKIDGSFMENLSEPDGTRPIVDAVLSMAHTLGLRVVAEGVETAEQLNTLRQGKCDLIQGYFFSRPVQAEAAAGFLVSGRLEGEERAITPTVSIAPAEQRERECAAL